MHAPLGTLHQDITTWYQQILSDCRHESIWPSSTTDGSTTNVDFPAQRGINTDNILSSHSSFKHNQDTHMHNPDQVAHTLYPNLISSQQDLDTVDKGIVLDTNLTERSLPTEESLSFPVSLLEVSDLPGFATLNPDEVTPPAMTDDTNLQWISSEVKMAYHSPHLQFGIYHHRHHLQKFQKLTLWLHPFPYLLAVFMQLVPY